MLPLHKTVALLQFLWGWLAVVKGAVKTLYSWQFLTAISYHIISWREPVCQTKIKISLFQSFLDNFTYILLLISDIVSNTRVVQVALLSESPLYISQTRNKSLCFPPCPPETGNFCAVMKHKQLKQVLNQESGSTVLMCTPAIPGALVFIFVTKVTSKLPFSLSIYREQANKQNWFSSQKRRCCSKMLLWCQRSQSGGENSHHLWRSDVQKSQKKSHLQQYERQVWRGPEVFL